MEQQDTYWLEDGSGWAGWVYDAEIGGGGGGGAFDFGNPWAVSSFGYDPFTTIDAGGSGGGLLDGLGNLFGGGNGIPISIPGGGSGPDVNEQLTAIVNAAERALQNNLAAWQQGSVSATVAVQTGWDLMNRMVDACYRFGAVGQNSAAERDRRIDPSRLRWDWIAYYIDPISGGPSNPATLPGVVTGLTPITGTGPLNGTFSTNGANAYLWAGLAAVVLLLILSRR